MQTAKTKTWIRNHKLVLSIAGVVVVLAAIYAYASLQTNVNFLVPISFGKTSKLETNCYTVSIPQDTGSSRTMPVVGKAECRVSGAFQNAAVGYGDVNFYSSPGSALVWHASYQRFTHITIDGNKGICQKHVSAGSASRFDILPARIEEDCTFTTAKKYPVQTYAGQAGNPSNVFSISINLHTTNQVVFDGIASSILNSIHWQ